MNYFLRSLSLQTKLSIFFWIMSIVLICFSVVDVLKAVEIKEQAERIEQINDCSEPLILTLEALAFERGRTNVVLAGEAPISEDNRSFINERRTQVDKNFNTTIDRVGKFNPRMAEILQHNYGDLQRLRSKVDAQAILPRQAREPMLGEEWFAHSTNFINNILEFLQDLEQRDDNTGQFGVLHHFQLDCIEFRLFSGQSASILTASVNKGLPFTPEKYQDFIESRAKADYIWHSIEITKKELNSPKLQSVTDGVSHKYYYMYRPFQDEVLPQALKGNTSAESVWRLTILSVPALDSAFELAHEISAEKRNYTKQMNSRASDGVKAVLLKLLLVLMFITLAHLYFRAGLFAPLKRIIDSLRMVEANQQVGYLASDAARRDEIGLLAEGVHLLQLSMQEERRLKEINETLAITDRLTGLYNRQMLEQTIEQIMAHADRYEEPVSMILFDLDKFKLVNDTYGHPIGDEVLIQTAQIAKKVIRSSDMLFRFGGEEFLVLMPQTADVGVANAAEKIRTALEEARHPVAGQVTASLGVAVRLQGEAFDDWYKRTDEALYQAKSQGRNRVVFSEDSIPVASVHMVCRSEWESGHPEIDAQHQQLLSKVDGFFSISLLPGVDLVKTLPFLEKVLQEISHHFAFEGSILEQIGYPDAGKHKRIHEELLAKAMALKEDYIKGTLRASAFISYIIDDVVMGHMLKEDVRFFPYIKKESRNLKQ